MAGPRHCDGPGETRIVTVLRIDEIWIVRVEIGETVEDLPVSTELEATRLAATLGSAMRRWRPSNATNGAPR